MAIEVQRPDLWWLTTGDGPGTELRVRVGLISDIGGQVRILVEAVIAGSLLDDGQRPAHQWLGLLQTVGGPQQVSQITEPDGDVGMLGAPGLYVRPRPTTHNES